MGSNWVYITSMGQRVITNCYIALIGPSIYTFWMSSFRLWLFVVFDFSQKKPLRFFGSGPIWGHFGFFMGNNPGKQCLILLSFWAHDALIVAQMPVKAFWRTQISTVTGLTQSFSFWSKFDPNLPPEDCRN